MVNILMSTYNGEQYLVEQLDSIFEQSYQDFVLYVRDDGSTDSTVKILREYQSRLSNRNKMIICSEKNVGFCISFFRLLEMSTEGDYWAFSDQDDVWYKDKLLHAVEWLEGRNQNIPQMYHSGIVFADEKMNPIKKYELGNYKYCFQKSITSSAFYGFSMVINKCLRKELLKCNYNKIFYHDWFIGMIVTGFGEYCFSDVVDSAHRIHSSNTSAVSLASKIPLIKKVLTEESYYNMQAREFKRRFYNYLSEEDKKILCLFDQEGTRFIKALKKAFFPHRWNKRLFEELGIRVLMLIGRI